jgi:hypothetical protein
MDACNGQTGVESSQIYFGMIIAKKSYGSVKSKPKITGLCPHFVSAVFLPHMAA